MFELLTKGFQAARNRLQGLTELTEDNLESVLRDVRVSLLEADVELGVIKRFLERVKTKALGQVVQTRIEHQGKALKVGPGEQFIRICQEELESMMRADGEPLVFAKPGQVAGIMMVGLQGAGKTTSAGKLARWLESQGKKPIMVAADVQRPGAIDQLNTLGARLNIPVFSIPGGSPVDICIKGLEQAKRTKRDVIIYDTAGRLSIDEALMQELADVKAATAPQNILLTVDAMIGQDAVRTAANFHERLQLSGVILTKVDGDARGGAALSVKEVTGAPIRFIGTGEALDRFELFRAEGFASRILGFGDVIGLMKDFEQVADVKKAEVDAQRMLKGQFTLDDFVEQLEMIQKMGPLKDIMGKLPMFGGAMPEGVNLDDRELVRTKAVISSMTKAERRKTELFQKEPGRLKRVAKGAGRKEADVAELVQRFNMMRQLMGNIGQQAGMLGRIPGMKQLSMANRLKDAVSMGGLEGNPMLSGFASDMLEAAVAGQRPFADAAPKKLTQADKNKKKLQRKQQKQARRKSRH